MDGKQQPTQRKKNRNKAEQKKPKSEAAPVSEQPGPEGIKEMQQVELKTDELKLLIKNWVHYLDLKTQELKLRGLEFEKEFGWYFCLIEDCAQDKSACRLLPEFEREFHFKTKHPSVHWESETDSTRRKHLKISKFNILYNLNTGPLDYKIDVTPMIKLLEELNPLFEGRLKYFMYLNKGYALYPRLDYFLCLADGCEHFQTEPAHKMELIIDDHIKKKHITMDDEAAKKRVRFTVVFIEKDKGDSQKTQSSSKAKSAELSQTAKLDSPYWLLLPPKPTTKCDACSCGFTILAKCNAHEKTYTKNKRIKCGLCTFTEAEDWLNKKDSLEVVTEKMEKLELLPSAFVCHICKGDFSTKDDLKKHTELEHKVTIHDKYECIKCSAVYYDENDMKFHIKRHRKNVSN